MKYLNLFAAVLCASAVFVTSSPTLAFLNGCFSALNFYMYFKRLKEEV